MYWAWWISWAPFVGLFIARISRGRTIREYERYLSIISDDNKSMMFVDKKKIVK